ncbi:MAG: hypothetical protein KBS63_05905 [Clostridiales bacterium]|nr:hypothetical protein [Candidatus Crickella caballi]
MAIALASCGGRTENEANYEDSVNVALENRDFVKAYRFASKCGMTSSVVSKEAAYVLEEQGEAGLVRLQMIVNEHDASWLYLDMLKMAISMGNESLAMKIYKMGNQCDEQAVDYAVTADMKDLIIAFLNRNMDFIDKLSVKDYLEEKGIYENTRSAIEKKRQEEKANKEKAERSKSVASIREKLKKVSAKIEGTKPPKGLQRYWLGSEMLKGEIDGFIVSNPQHITYFISSQKANTELDELLSDAIKAKDLSLCKEIIASYKETIEVTTGRSYSQVKVDGQVVDGDHSYIKYTYADKNAAQKVLDEAIRARAFK